MKSKRELSRELESQRKHQRRKMQTSRWNGHQTLMFGGGRQFCRCSSFLDIYTRGNMMEPPSPFARQSVVRKNVDRQSVVESHFAKSSHASRNDNATFSELTKSANEEPGGVLRNRNRSICVQPDDLRNPRQVWSFGLIPKRA